MNIGHECKREGTDRDGYGCVPCSWPRSATKSKVLIRYVGRERRRTHDEGGPTPYKYHLIGGGRPGQCGGCDTNGEVDQPDEYRSTKPSFAARVAHACALTINLT